MLDKLQPSYFMLYLGRCLEMNSKMAIALYNNFGNIKNIFDKYNASWLNSSSYIKECDLVFRVAPTLKGAIESDIRSLGFIGYSIVSGMQVTFVLRGYFPQR